MKKLTLIIKSIPTLLVLLFVFTGCSNQSGNQGSKQSSITYSFLSAEECAEMLGRIDYFYDSMSQKFLDFACQKKGATVEEYKEYSMAQALDFTEAEKEIIDNSMARIMKTIEENGYRLPSNNKISFAKTTMIEALGAGGYTHETTIFLG